MKKLLFILFFITIFIFNSCKTSFDVNAEWEDISVVYCLLDPNDSIHYVKLNKCFLGEESAYVMAQISDSSNYADAKVKLISGTLKKSGEFIEDESGQVIILEKTNEIGKDPGIFANDINILYRTPGSATILDKNKDYKLLIEIDGKNIIDSYTHLISLDQLNISNLISLNLSEIGSSVIGWRSIENAKLYEMSVLFTYTEIYGNDTTTKTISWAQQSKESKHTDGNESMSISIKGEMFLQYVASTIKNAPDYNPNALRVVNSYIIFPNDPNNPRNKYPISLKYYVATEDLNTYIQVSQPTSTIVQEKPSFSNINNGLGIFSSRSDKIIHNLRLSNQTLDDLSGSEITKDLNFLDYYETASFWSHNE